MTPKMETAAQKYRREKSQKRQLHEVTCLDPNCSMVWQCRKAPLVYWIESGTLPSSLAAVMLKAVKSGRMAETDAMKALSDFSEQQLAQSIEFNSKVVRYTAVEPRIVETPAGPNDLGYDEVDTCCYKTLRDWQMKGGDGAAPLETFRSE